MTTFYYTLTLTDSEHIWLERIITSVIEDPTNNTRLRGAARELRRKIRDAEEDAIMMSTRVPAGRILPNPDQALWWFFMFACTKGQYTTA